APRLEVARAVRGPLGAQVVAVPDRDERLPRLARGTRPPGTADGSRAGAGAAVREPRRAAGGHVDHPVADAGRARGAARVAAARLRRRTPAPAASAARRAHPLRGAEV